MRVWGRTIDRWLHASRLRDQAKKLRDLAIQLEVSATTVDHLDAALNESEPQDLSRSELYPAPILKKLPFGSWFLTRPKYLSVEAFDLGDGRKGYVECDKISTHVWIVTPSTLETIDVGESESGLWVRLGKLKTHSEWDSWRGGFKFGPRTEAYTQGDVPEDLETWAHGMWLEAGRIIALAIKVDEELQIAREEQISISKNEAVQNALASMKIGASRK